jgi:hypothetical protein
MLDLSHLNPASAWRLELARPIAEAYAEHTNVAAVIVGGSTSRGYADRYSDIEIGVFWHQPPTDEDRQQCAKASGAEIHGLYPYDAENEVWEDVLYAGHAAPDQPASGVLVEIPHYTIAFVERIIADVVERYDPAEDKLTLLSAFGPAIPLYGDVLIEAWRECITPYPRELALAVVKRHAQIEFLWRSDMLLERGNNLLLLNEMYVKIGKQLTQVLFALNGIYFPGFKWLHHITAGLPIAPPEFNTRLQQVFASEPRAGAEALRGLVEETYTLIETHMPEIDVTRLRHWFRYRRQPWDAPPAT